MRVTADENEWNLGTKVLVDGEEISLCFDAFSGDDGYGWADVYVRGPDEHILVDEKTRNPITKRLYGKVEIKLPK